MIIIINISSCFLIHTFYKYKTNTIKNFSKYFTYFPFSSGAKALLAPKLTAYAKTGLSFTNVKKYASSASIHLIFQT